MKNSLSKKIIDKPYILWSVLFIIAPLLMVIYYAFTDTTGAFSLESIKAIPEYTSTILLSILYGIAATAICLVVAYPFAYFLSKLKFSTQSMMVLLVMLPMWMNFLIRTYSWMTILGDTGIINTFLNALGLNSLQLINTGGAVILGMVYNFLPFMVLPLYASIEKLDSRLLDAARDLGANGLRSFWHVTLPLTLPGIVAGSMLVFLPSLGAFYIPEILGGAKSMLIGNFIKNQFMVARDWPLGAAASTILTVLLALLIVVYRIANRRAASRDRGDGVAE